MPKFKNIKLPKKPSALIRIALEDLGKCERDKQYQIDMETWHSPVNGGKCEVCFAGSVMAKRGGLDASIVADAERFPLETWAKLKALDCFRRGDWETALDLLGISKQRSKALDALRAADLDTRFSMWDENNAIPSYRINPKAFKAAMRKAAAVLEKVGL